MLAAVSVAFAKVDDDGNNNVITANLDGKNGGSTVGIFARSSCPIDATVALRIIEGSTLCV